MGPPPATTCRLPRRPVVAARAGRRRRRHRGATRRPAPRSRTPSRSSPSSRRSTPMIITRTPLRISLGGGGTDLPSYYREAGHGFLIAAAITKYVYIAVHRNFDDDVHAQVLRGRAGPEGRRRRPPAAAPLPAARPASTAPSRSRRWPTSRPGPGSVRRDRSPSACSRRCARYRHQHVSTSTSPPRRATSRSTCSVSRWASRTSTSPRSAGSPASSSTPTSGSRSCRST